MARLSMEQIFSFWECRIRSVRRWARVGGGDGSGALALVSLPSDLDQPESSLSSSSSVNKIHKIWFLYSSNFFVLSQIQCDLNWVTSSVWAGASVSPNSSGTKPLIAVWPRIGAMHSSGRERGGIPSSPSVASTVSRCAEMRFLACCLKSDYLYFNSSNVHGSKLRRFTTYVTFCHLTCFILLLTPELKAAVWGFEKKWLRT